MSEAVNDLSLIPQGDWQTVVNFSKLMHHLPNKTEISHVNNGSIVRMYKDKRGNLWYNVPKRGPVLRLTPEVIGILSRTAYQKQK